MKKYFQQVKIPRQCLLLMLGITLGNMSSMAQSSQPANEALAQLVKPMQAAGWYKFGSDVTMRSKEDVNLYKASFGLGTKDNLRFQKEERDEYGQVHRRYDQYHGGVRVVGGEFIVHEKNGKASIANGYLVKDLKVNTAAKITESSALELALQRVGATSYMWEVPQGDELAKLFGKESRQDYYPKGELVIMHPHVLFGNSNKTHLAYSFLIHAAEPNTVQWVYVDAHNGNVIMERNALHEANHEGKAKTKYSGEKKITTDHYPGGFRLREKRGAENVTIVTLNMNKKEGLDSLTEFNDADNYWNNINANQDEEAGDIHWGQEVSYDYFLNVHGRNSIDGEGHPLVAFGNWSLNVFNAQSGSFGPGGMQATRYGNGTGDGGLTMLDVVGHEITHSLVAFSARLGATYVSAGLNESFADIFGVSMSFWAGVPEDKIWYLADEVGGIRNMADPKSLGDPDTWKGEFWSDGPQTASVHKNGNVQDYWYYLLCEGGSGVNDNNDAYDVTPIGVKKGEKIAFRALTVYLTSASEYPETRAATLQAAEDIYGIASDEYAAVANAWYAVGVGSPVSPFDVGVVGVLSPNSTCDLLGSEEEVSLAIKYFGGKDTLAAGTLIPVAYQINNGDTIVDTLALPTDLLGGHEEKVDFKIKADLSAPGTYLIRAWTALDADINQFNDSFEKSVTSFTGPQGDVGVSAIVAPIPGTVVLSSSEAVKVSVTNFSCYSFDPQTVIPVSYQLNNGAVQTESLVLQDTLFPNQSVEFEFATKGDFTIADFISMEAKTAYSIDPKADNNANNAGYGIIRNFPYENDFESGADGWLSQSLKGTDVWELGTPAQTVLNKAASGVNAWMTDLDANHPDLSKMVLVSPAYDFSNLELPVFCFDLLFHTEQDWDAMVVEYSTGDSAWHKIMMPGYNSFNNEGTTVTIDQPWYSGTNNDWALNCVKLPGLKGEPTVWFRFHFESDDATNDEGVAIDNVSVREGDAYDLAVTSLVGPSNGDLTSEEIITIGVANYGIKTNFNVQLSYQVNGGVFVKEDTSLTIPFEDTVEFSFLTKADFSARGGYLINASVAAANDANVTNDTLKDNLVINNREVIDFPYLQDFETFNEGDETLSEGFINEVANDNSNWIAQKRSSYFPIAGAFQDHTTGTGLFLGSDLIGFDGDKNAHFSTPRFNVDDLANPMVEFWYQVYDEDGYLRIDVIDSVVHENVLVFGSGQKDNQWKHAVISLNRFSSPVQLRFRNEINGSAYSLAGIDDLGVRDFELIDAALVSINAPKSTSCLDKEAVSLGVKNLGSLDITTFELELMVNHADTSFTIKETVSDTSIASVGTYVHQLGQLVDLSRLGKYTLTAKVNLEDDQLLTNNTMVYEVENLSPVSVFPFKEDFAAFDLNNPTKMINGWANATDHDLDWMVAKTTPSSGTGPSRDHSGDGKFIYVEASGNFNLTAKLLSPCFDVSDLNNPTLEFWFHMYGETMGNLQLDVFDGTWHEDVWSISGDQGDKWNRVQLPIGDFGSQLKLRFKGLVGPSFRSDIALDDIMVTEGQSTFDIAITKVITPQTGCANGPEKVSVEVYNYSSSTIESGLLSYAYQLDGNPVITEVLPIAIAGNSFQVIDFQDSIALNEGAHVIDFRLELLDDIDTTNNVITHEFISYDNNLFDNKLLTSCENEIIPLDLKAPGIESWTWMPNNNGNPVFYATESGLYKATVKYVNGCEVSDSVLLAFNNLPEPVLDSGAFCGSVVLDPGTFGTYLWQNGDTATTHEANVTALYYVTVSNDSGCYATTSTNIAITEKPLATFTTTNVGYEFTFTPLADSTGTDSTYIFAWDLGDGTGSSNRVVTHTYAQPGTFTVVLTVTTADGVCVVEGREVIVIVGIESQSFADLLNAYPNPGSGLFNIALITGENQSLDVQVSDNLGRIVLNDVSLKTAANVRKEFNIDLSSMDKGIYLLQVKNNEGEYAFKKLIVK